MPACWEGEYTEPFGFVRSPFNFSGPGDGVFGGSLQSTAALLVNTCERDGRVGAMHRFLFTLPPLNFYGARGETGSGFW